MLECWPGTSPPDDAVAWSAHLTACRWTPLMGCASASVRIHVGWQGSEQENQKSIRPVGAYISVK